MATESSAHFSPAIFFLVADLTTAPDTTALATAAPISGNGIGIFIYYICYN
jgi:hypothetical protein